jgi:hypothetical protein
MKRRKTGSAQARNISRIRRDLRFDQSYVHYVQPTDRGLSSLAKNYRFASRLLPVKTLTTNKHEKRHEKNTNASIQIRLNFINSNSFARSWCRFKIVCVTIRICEFSSESGRNLKCFCVLNHLYCSHLLF